MRCAGILAGEPQRQICGAVFIAGRPFGTGRGLHSAGGLSDRGGARGLHHGI